MFHNLYPLSSTGYMNLRRALFLHDLISDEEIDICAHIFHILRKTILQFDSRACIPFCCLISRILKLKGVHPSEDESPTRSQVQSTIVHSMLALVIVERESRQRLQHLIVVYALAHPHMMRSWITL